MLVINSDSLAAGYVATLLHIPEVPDLIIDPLFICSEVLHDIPVSPGKWPGEDFILGQDHLFTQPFI